MFALTDDGGGPTLAPTSANFGSQAVGFSTAPQKFTWKNNSTFPLLVSSATVSGDYAVTSNPCGSVAAGASCEIDVVFKPTAIGPSAGTLTVVSAAKTLTATLTGIGIPDLAASATSLAFGSVDIGASVTKVFTITNNAPGPVPVPPLVLTGDYSATSTCGTSLGSSSSCAISVVFTPTATGARNGILTVNSTAQAYSGLSAALTGNGCRLWRRLQSCLRCDRGRQWNYAGAHPFADRGLCLADHAAMYNYCACVHLYAFTAFHCADRNNERDGDDYDHLEVYGGGFIAVWVTAACYL